MDCAPKVIDFNPEEQTLLIVVQGTSTPSPARTAACRAGACPSPAPKTLPKITSSASLGSRLIELKAALVAIYPSSTAGKDESLLLKEPIGVLLAAMMYTALPRGLDCEKRYFMLIKIME